MILVVGPFTKRKQEEKDSTANEILIVEFTREKGGRRLSVNLYDNKPEIREGGGGEEGYTMMREVLKGF